MTSEYTRQVLRVVVAQICQTIGWHSINSSPLEFMVDLMQEYILRISKLSHDYAEICGRTEVNLDDLGVAFHHLNIDLNEIAEYVKNVDPVPCVVGVPKLPIHRESHLNFLKPGSREVVTRPVHIHDYLPPMYPEVEEEYSTEEKIESGNTSLNNELCNSSEEDSGENNSATIPNETLIEESSMKDVSQSVFKRPGDPISVDGPVSKRPKVSENGRLLREIHSVIMTTSGLLSTAVEGKLPEKTTPFNAQERLKSPSPEIEEPVEPIIPPDIPVEKKLKKIPKKMANTDSFSGKLVNKENKKNKEKIRKCVLFEPDKVKKLTGMKELAKLKVLKPGSKAGNLNVAGPSSVVETTTGKVIDSSIKNGKNNVAGNKIKSEKSSDNIHNSGNLLTTGIKEEPIDKLPIELDKQKLNIFKKISSKSKEDKDKEAMENSQHKLKELNSDSISSTIDVEACNFYDPMQADKKSIVQNNSMNNDVRVIENTEIISAVSPDSEEAYGFSEMSPPRTPGTPKTPDINVPLEQKKRKKDKNGKKKEQKIKVPKSNINSKKARLSNDSATSEVEILDRPKTPQALEQPISRDPNVLPMNTMPNFSPFLPVPGLIPNILYPPYLQKGMIPPTMMGGPNSAIMRPNIPMPHLFRPPGKLDPVSKQPITSSFVGEPNFPGKSPLASQNRTSNDLHSQDMTVNNVGAGGIPPPLTQTTLSPAVVPAPLLPPNSIIDPEIMINKSLKPEKMDKVLKKLKEHKKDKKDKLKKKKEKKEKHREKGEKVKEKKDKSEKKDKLEKIKEKKEKKEKRKEKEAIKKITKEEKMIEAVPKITLKLGPAGGSPRPPTPDSGLTKKITIKPPKKPDEDVKREPTPELARISALVTRPPKQKTSKKLDYGLVDYSFVPTGASLSNPNSRIKKPIFKPMPVKDSYPNHYTNYLNPYDNSSEPQMVQYKYTTKADTDPKKEDKKEDKEYGGNSLSSVPAVSYVDAKGNTVWICPACGKQDDGTPMIGCDDCDGWYHWECVGIQVPPASNEDWYCLICIAKKQEQYHDKKKKKRKKKNPV